MRIKAMVKRIITQMIRDKRTLALMFVAPLFILTLMYFLFNGETTNPKLGVVGVDTNIVSALKDNNVDVTEYDNADNSTIINDNLDGLLISDNGSLSLTLQNSDTTASKPLEMKINGVLTSQMVKEIVTLTNGKVNAKAPELDISYIYGNADTAFFDVLMPILIGFFVFFFVFIISGIGLLRERTTGTLERLISTPIKRWEIVIGYLAGYGVFAVVQTFIVVFYAVNVLNITIAGSIWNVILINLLTAFVALSLGILLSSFATTEFQMLQFIPIVVIPQVFFAGIISIDGMAKWLQVIAKFIPMYYVGSALQDVMYKGAKFADITTQLAVLCLFAIVFVVLNIQALKKYRKL